MFKFFCYLAEFFIMTSTVIGVVYVVARAMGV